MPDPLMVDPLHLELAGSILQGQVLPEPPPPLVANGADEVSTAINVTMPTIEAPVVEGLPAAQAAITATGSKIATAARMYAETDQKLGQQLGQAQFSATKDQGAPQQLNAANAAPHSPMPGGSPQLSSAPPPDQSPHPTTLTAGGPGAPDPSGAAGPSALNPDVSDDPFNPTAFAAQADPEGLGDTLGPGVWDGQGDADASDGDPQDPGDLASAGGPGIEDGSETDDGPGTDAGPGTDGGTATETDPGSPDELQSADGPVPGNQNGPGTADGSKPPAESRPATDPAAQQNRAAPAPPRGPGAGGRNLFSSAQAGAGPSGRGIPQSLAGSPKPTAAPHRPAAAHASPGQHAPVTPPAAAGTSGRSMPVGSVAGHPVPLSPAAPAVPLSPTTPSTPHDPVAPAMPQTPAPAQEQGGPGPSAPAAPPSTPSPLAAPGTSPVATDSTADTGSKGATASAATPPARGRDGALASIPVSAARAERDAVAEAATADASRRDGVDPLLLARRIAAALNVPRTEDEDEEEDFGFFWVTAVTTEGAIVVANSYGIAYIPEGVFLPEPVYLVSADDEIPAADRASWATYPVIAVQAWADHHEFTLRAVIATEEQLADSSPGVEKVVLEPDDIPDSGEMSGRSRLEVVDPRTAESLAAIPDESLRDRLPPAPADVSPPAEEEGMLWFEVMEPMFSTDTGREDVHLRAFRAYAAQAEQLALRAAHRRVDLDTRRDAISEWLYWKHVAALHDAALDDPAYRRRTADLYDESTAVPD